MNKIEQLKSEIAQLQKQIENIQEACTHPPLVLTKVHTSNSGGYDGPAHDLYWTEFYCELCEKHWDEDGSK